MLVHCRRFECSSPPHHGAVSLLFIYLQSKAGCDALCDAFKAKESKLHILVNNSGATWGAALNDFPEKQGWDKIMSLNVKSIFYSTSVSLRRSLLLERSAD